MELGIESAEKIAEKLITVATDIGNIINNIEKMARLNAQQITEESEAYETIVISGEAYIKALRTMAMRFDRAAIVKNIMVNSII